MKFETLRNNRKILLGTVIVFVIILTLIISTSLAKYKVTESIKIASGTINYSPADFSLMGIYLESESGYTQSDTIPESGYTLNKEESYCKVGDTEQDVTINYDVSSQTLTIIPMTNKGMKCYLYFDKQVLAKDAILANATTMSTRNDYSSPITESSTGILYTAEDDDGTSYYFAGAATDNYLKFAGFYWRIIRINGDGTIRLIYNGKIEEVNETGKETVLKNGYDDSETLYTQIGKSRFNSSDNDNMYVGYMYTSGSLHGLGTSSTIKGELDSWYNNNLASYAENIDVDAGFCGDRSAYTDETGTTSGGGTGTTQTYYGAYIRLFTNKLPSFKCPNSSDLYTINNSIKGNKALTNPIGLITADEVSYAGGVYDIDNAEYYLYSGNNYWTITPSSLFRGTYAALFASIYSGNFYECTAYTSLYGGSFGVRPVINLNAKVTILGSGTIENPYVVANELPPTTEVYLTTTESTITVSAIASGYNEISKYYYSIDDGDYISSNANNYTFRGLETGTTHTIKVYVLDESNNQSDIITSSVTTKNEAAKTTILAHKTISERTDFSNVFESDTTGTIFTAEDDDGTSYYYAGATTDNWLKFAGYYWRIIRINGNGTIRLIYNGTSTTTTGESTQIGTSAFNTSKDNTEYTGYMYTIGSVHGLGTSSTIKGVLESWYSNNLTDYTSYIDIDTGFCGDRSSYTNATGTTSGGGTGTTVTYYGAYIRISNEAPSFKCVNNSDLYTISSSSKGNKSLTNPIGLITADEVMYAGAIHYIASTITSNNYLKTEQDYWTMTPYIFGSGNGAYSRIIITITSGIMTDVSSVFEGGVRPVINLKANVTLSGAGTTSNPYEIEGIM